MNRLRLPPAALSLITAVAAAAVVGCTTAEPTVSDVPDATPATGGFAINEDIPVEALPDPLPAPYLFRDEITIERPAITETVYVVQPGDTLASIAEQFCLTLEELQRLNNIVDIDTLDVGQELRIPIREGGCDAAQPEDEEEDQEDEQQSAPARPPGEIYIVQEGDTLSDIADAFGLSWLDLMLYNELTEFEAGALDVGQALIIPDVAQEDELTEPPG